MFADGAAAAAAVGGIAAAYPHGGGGDGTTSVGVSAAGLQPWYVDLLFLAANGTCAEEAEKELTCHIQFSEHAEDATEAAKEKCRALAVTKADKDKREGVVGAGSGFGGAYMGCQRNFDDAAATIASAATLAALAAVRAEETACDDRHFRVFMDRFSDATLAAEYGVAAGTFAAAVDAVPAATSPRSGLLQHFSADTVLEWQFQEVLENRLLTRVFQNVSKDAGRLAAVVSALAASGWATPGEMDVLAGGTRILPKRLGGDLDLKAWCGRTGGPGASKGEAALAVFLEGIGVDGAAAAAANVCTFATNLDKVRALRTTTAPVYGSAATLEDALYKNWYGEEVATKYMRSGPERYTEADQVWRNRYYRTNWGAYGFTQADTAAGPSRCLQNTFFSD